MLPRLPIGLLAALAAATTACGSLRPPAPLLLQDEHSHAERPPVHGYGAITFSAPAAEGSVLVEGVGESSSGSHRAAGIGGLIEVRTEVVFVGIESTFVGLPSQLDLDVAGDSEHQRTEYRHTEVIVGAELLRVPAAQAEGELQEMDIGGRRPLPTPALSLAPFLGGRFSRFVVREDYLDDGHGEAWADAIAGARVEARLARGVMLRLKGDTLVFGRSDEAWRASAAVVFGDGNVRGAVGWEAHSVDFEGDTGLERVKYSVLLQGPFVAIEFWF